MLLTRTLTVAMLIGLVFLGTGCRMLRYDPSGPNLLGNAPVANPLVVPLVDRWLVMDQVSDEMDNYFKIYREQRIQILDGVLSEGWIETHPRIGSTLLEPWHVDSTPGFEKIHATLQTVRRFAKVRVIPTGNSYQIDVKVFKELEDLPSPIGAAVTGPLLRYDNALDVGQTDQWLSGREKGWIPMGRDISLEQQILRNIQGRITGESRCNAGQ